ncbi:MAG TPA: hypothetical protein VK590_00160 [Saprospiraceae bacterium]|nr:hypothetical protein [Saprospiraceae bacterium]
MIRNIFLLIVLILLSTQTAYSQSEYKVMSIDSIPLIKHYIIILKSIGKKYKIISPYYQDSLIKDNYVLLTVGKKVKLNLKKIYREDHHIKIGDTLFQNQFNTYYYDGKLYYDPKEQLYYSECIKDLSLNLNCKD